MQITLTFPDDKVAGLAAAFNTLTPRLDPEDNGGKNETDPQLIKRHLKSYITDQEQVYRMRVATQQTQPDEDIVNVTDVAP